MKITMLFLAILLFVSLQGKVGSYVNVQMGMTTLSNEDEINFSQAKTFSNSLKNKIQDSLKIGKPLNSKDL
jgi:hypothetical protein